MKRITLDLDDELHEEIRREAFELHTSMAAIIRSALAARTQPQEEA